jgi:hypothetical protein
MLGRLRAPAGGQPNRDASSITAYARARGAPITVGVVPLGAERAQSQVRLRARVRSRVDSDTSWSFFFLWKDTFHYLKAQYRYGAKHAPIKVLECTLHSTLSRMHICFAREKARTRNCWPSCLLCELVSHLVCVPADLSVISVNSAGIGARLSCRAATPLSCPPTYLRRGRARSSSIQSRKMWAHVRHVVGLEVKTNQNGQAWQEQEFVSNFMVPHQTSSSVEPGDRTEWNQTATNHPRQADNWGSCIVRRS